MELFESGTIISEAKFSVDKKHRYFLKRVWKPKGTIATVIMLNPTKKADAIRYDKSVMLMNNYFAEQVDQDNRPVYGGFIVVNLFSYRSKSEEEMKEDKLYDDRFDKDTDTYILEAIKQSKDIYIAWGSNNNRMRRVKKVKEILQSHSHNIVYKLKKKNNKNVHPSMYSGDLQFEPINVSDLDK